MNHSESWWFGTWFAENLQWQSWNIRPRLGHDDLTRRGSSSQALKAATEYFEETAIASSICVSSLHSSIAFFASARLISSDHVKQGTCWMNWMNCMKCMNCDLSARSLRGNVWNLWWPEKKRWRSESRSAPLVQQTIKASSHRKSLWKSHKANYLVGGLEHQFYFPIYWEFHHPNWLSYFSEGWPNHQPVTYLRNAGIFCAMAISIPPGDRVPEGCLGSSPGHQLSGQRSLRRGRPRARGLPKMGQLRQFER